MPTDDDDRRVKEIENWFDERGYDLLVHEAEGRGWRAPNVPKGSRIGSAAYGIGKTPREAAEDAQARYTGDNPVDVRATASMPAESTKGVSKEIGIAVETDTAMPITARKSKAIEPAVETDIALGRLLWLRLAFAWREWGSRRAISPQPAKLGVSGSSRLECHLGDRCQQQVSR